MNTIKPNGLRIVDDHDTLPFYAYSGQTYPLLKGSIVKVISSGMVMTNTTTERLGNVGASFPNTVSLRYGSTPKVSHTTSFADVPVGITLYDVRETDENGEKLVFNPRKQAEMQAILSGQAVPIATRGTFLCSGISGIATGGARCYAGPDGGIHNTGSVVIGKFLGAADTNNCVLVQLDFAGA